MEGVYIHTDTVVPAAACSESTLVLNYSIAVSTYKRIMVVVLAKPAATCWESDCTCCLLLLLLTLIISRE